MADDSFSALLTQSAPCRRKPRNIQCNNVLCQWTLCHHKTLSK